MAASIDSINGLVSKRRSVTSGALQALVLFNFFISDIDSGIECTLSKSVDDTKLVQLICLRDGIHPDGP